MKEIIRTLPTPAPVTTGDQTDRLIVITKRKHVETESLNAIIHDPLNLYGTPKRSPDFPTQVRETRMMMSGETMMMPVKRAMRLK